jgi:flagellar export protein FliJ
MKRYRFRLETVLRVRRTQEDQAKAALLLANRAVADAETELTHRIDHYQGMHPTPGPRSLDAVMAERFIHELAATAVLDAGKARHLAIAAANDRRTEWSEAASRVSALERLDGRRREEYALELAREETAAVDDLVTGRFGRQR